MLHSAFNAFCSLKAVQSDPATKLLSLPEWIASDAEGTEGWSEAKRKTIYAEYVTRQMHNRMRIWLGVSQENVQREREAGPRAGTAEAPAAKPSDPSSPLSPPLPSLPPQSSPPAPDMLEAFHPDVRRQGNDVVMLCRLEAGQAARASASADGDMVLKADPADRKRQLGMAPRRAPGAGWARPGSTSRARRR